MHLVKYNYKLLQNNPDCDIGNFKKSNGFTDEMARQCMDNIINWYNSQSHLPKRGIDEDRLIRLLVLRDFNVEKCKRKIENLLTARELIPEFMNNRDPNLQENRIALDIFDWVVLPKLTEENLRVTLFRLTNKDASQYNPVNVIKMFTMITEYRSIYDTALGEQIVGDLTNFTFNHFIKITPSVIKTMVFIFRDCFAAKIKGIHLVNVPKYAEVAINIVKTAVGKKIASRFQIHDNLSDLHKVLPKRIIPSDLGGDEIDSKSIAESWRKFLFSNESREWILDLDTIKSDESKRLPDQKYDFDDLLGMHGSFRTLSVD